MISFIIPTLNEAAVLRKLLENLAGYHAPHEVIISDGRSTDGTIDIARELGASVVVYEGTTRQTIGDGRNLGARQARGDFLVFMDADISVPDPDAFFAAALKRFEADPRLVGITVKIRVFPEMFRRGDGFLSWFISTVNALQNNWLGVGAASGEFQMVRADAFTRAGGYNETIAASEDYEFFRRLSKLGRTRYVGSLTVYHTGRRAHKVGWFKLWMTWNINAVKVFLFGSSASKEWKEVR